MPRETGSRLLKDHEQENLKASYHLATAYVGGFLGREDGKRPAWFPRSHLVQTSSLTADQQEYLGTICHLVCTKVRQEATSEPGARQEVGAFSGAVKPPTAWKAALLCARVLWRAVFATAAGKAKVHAKATPLLFMCISDSINQAARKMLTEIWNEAQLQFTARINKYRNIKSRPPWDVLEKMEYKVFGDHFGFGLQDPSNSMPPAGTKPASNLHDWFEEVLALRFMVDWLSASMQDAQEFLDQSTRRFMKRPAPRTRIADNVVTMKLNELKEKSVDSFAQMWTDDAELRGVTSLASRVMDSLDGPSCAHFAAAFGGQILHAVWVGAGPMFARLAREGIARISEAHAAKGLIPPRSLAEHDADTSNTAAFDRVAASYGPPSKDCEELIQALPRGVVAAIVKVQATFRGYIFRARNYARARAVASYCKAASWPLSEPALFQADEDEGPKRGRAKRKKAAKKVDPKTLDKEIESFEPSVSKYLGGDGGGGGGASPSGTTRSTGGAAKTGKADPYERRSWPLPTADHRACADLFALYVYNMYRRREVTRMWQTLCGGYERGMEAFAALLEKNPALKPMLESIAAQLKRGSVVGYDKAFIAKHQGGGPEKTQKRTNDADLFKTGGAKSSTGGPGLDQTAAPGQAGATGGVPMSTMLPPMTLPLGAKDAKSETEVTGEYLAAYLKEMDGDDSQFKDISSAVIPLSTGTSPRRKPAAESILEKHTAEAGAAGGDEAAKKPKLDVPFCIKKLKPVWLPIKAHRFAAYRAKVLQLLPQKVLQQYIDFEKQGQYAACIKLLESATPGSLNVLSPATLVGGKPLLVETVLQLIVGYSGLCLKNGQGQVAVKLITQVLDNMSLALRDLHPGHRTVLEAYLFDTAMSVAFYMPQDISMTNRAESFFQQASERYLRLNHINRYCKCCLRAAAVLHNQKNLGEAEYYTQQALNKLSDAPVSSLLTICYHNLGVHTMVQNRLSDGVAHVRSYVALLRQLPKLSNSWMQQMDDTQWLILKISELWASYQESAGMRDSNMIDGGKI